MNKFRLLALSLLMLSCSESEFNSSNPMTKSPKSEKTGKAGKNTTKDVDQTDQSNTPGNDDPNGDDQSSKAGDIDGDDDGDADGNAANAGDEDGVVNICRKKNKSRIVVANDEWQFSNVGFENSPESGKFAQNIALWLGGCKERPHGVFHAYSNNFSLTEPKLAAALQQQGHTWTMGTNIEASLDSFLKYDWIFLAGDIPNRDAVTKVLLAYVKAGGGLYIAAGTGSFSGDAPAEAATWNTILNEYGLSYAPAYNHIQGVMPISSTHPIFAGITGLYQNNGNTIVKTATATNQTQILIDKGGQGLYAIYDGSAAP